MITVELIGKDQILKDLSYVVIAARYGSGWLFIKHRKRGGYELPAGHPDQGESSEAAAARELAEETGAEDFTIEPVSYYSVDNETGKQYGRLFLAEVRSLGDISDITEIEEVRVFSELPPAMSLKEVMTFLFNMAKEYFRYSRH
ncbi:MAG: NUDIX domain-containing protein [Bacteroidales bacterium]|nr:NUDIX domain-containing protein [Bacteroidales bacterium]